MDGRPGSPGDGAGLLAATPNGVYVDCGLLYSKMEHSAHGVCAVCASFFECMSRIVVERNALNC